MRIGYADGRTWASMYRLDEIPESMRPFWDDIRQIGQSTLVAWTDATRSPEEVSCADPVPQGREATSDNIEGAQTAEPVDKETAAVKSVPPKKLGQDRRIPEDTDYSGVVAHSFATAGNGQDIFVSSIPEKKLAKAKQLFKETLSPDEVPLVLMDNTVFFSVKKGVLLTSIACHHQTDKGSGSFRYADIVSVAGKQGWPDHGIIVVIPGGSVHTVALPNGPAMDAFETFLSKVVPNS